MFRLLLFFTFSCLATLPVLSQNRVRLSGLLADPARTPVEAGTVSLLRGSDSALVKIGTSASNGLFELENLVPGKYLLQIQALGYAALYRQLELPAAGLRLDTLFLQPQSGSLGNVTVRSQKPFIELKSGVTIVNVDAAVTNVGANVLELLEKSPGVAVDKDGNISLKGRQNVLVWMDGKQTYLPASELATMLSNMPASQLEQIEIMSNPTAKYDAAGSTGIIHLKTKKLRTVGFNGNLTLSYGQGRYYKNNNSLQLNYRRQTFNIFLTYSFAANRSFTDLYAKRTYYETDDIRIRSLYEQYSFLFGRSKSHTIKTGIDYTLSKKSSLGLTVSGILSNRTNGGNSQANWISKTGVTDSSVVTGSDNSSEWKNLGLNLNFRHQFSKTQELQVDLDHLGYRIENNQFFINTQLLTAAADRLRGFLPSRVNIYSGKADYTQSFASGLKWEAGWKSARVSTDNIADYYHDPGGSWTQDLGKTNHFIYHENIHALYSNLQKQSGKLTIQAGLRYENTAYDAHQLGNAQRKDSAFSRQYDGFFPTAMLSLEMDSSNSFSFTAGRRIDRPAFQKLNPFVFLINKYTYQQGNPFFRPQYTWNFELTHNFRNKLMTSFSYGYTRDYFSQIFYANADNIIVYSEGNLGKMINYGLTLSTQLQPSKAWSMNLSASLNHKKIEGYVWSALRASLTTLNINMTNIFKLKKGWALELSGFFNTSEQELQEITDPFGQLSVGFSKQLFNNKASIKGNVRDIFYTQWMKGFTVFEHATEYFHLSRDTRVASLAFTWRFGKTGSGSRRSNAGVTEESKRMGSN
jgi:hypothetical protein